MCVYAHSHVSTHRQFVCIYSTKKSEYTLLVLLSVCILTLTWTKRCVNRMKVMKYSHDQRAPCLFVDKMQCETCASRGKINKASLNYVIQIPKINLLVYSKLYLIPHLKYLLFLSFNVQVIKIWLVVGFFIQSRTFSVSSDWTESLNTAFPLFLMVCRNVLFLVVQIIFRLCAQKDLYTARSLKIKIPANMHTLFLAATFLLDGVNELFLWKHIKINRYRAGTKRITWKSKKQMSILSLCCSAGILL